LSSRQLQQFHIYYDKLMEWNQTMNLTAITEEKEVYVKHFYDSLTLGFFHDFSNRMSLCDVGSGAGFPSLPLKIYYPNINVTLLDSLKKRTAFLQSLIDALQLHAVDIHHDRAETFAKKSCFRESFAVVTARAVANLSVL